MTGKLLKAASLFLMKDLFVWIIILFIHVVQRCVTGIEEICFFLLSISSSKSLKVQLLQDWFIKQFKDIIKNSDTLTIFLFLLDKFPSKCSEDILVPVFFSIKIVSRKINPMTLFFCLKIEKKFSCISHWQISSSLAGAGSHT